MGISVEEEVIDAIKLFREVRVLYIEASILEAMWKIVRIVPPEELGVVREGVEAIRNTYVQVVPGGSAFLEAHRLYRKGHRDLIDDLLYATSKERGVPFLTIDEEFVEFLRSVHEDTSLVITPENFRKMLR